ncbi:hypothetical protein V6Z11_A05G121500 [Gossypium hirsutum]
MLFTFLYFINLSCLSPVSLLFSNVDLPPFLTWCFFNIFGLDPKHDSNHVITVPFLPRMQVSR